MTYMQNNKYISILGDSISTYIGYQPYGYKVYYREDRLYDNELESVDDTWWMQVIDALGGTLCVNNSYSGSTVRGGFFPAACSDERCSSLHGEHAPDLILLYIGTNDRGYNVPLGMEEPLDSETFYGAYRLMLQKIKRNYPSAKIVCATLPMGKLQGGGDLDDIFKREDTRFDEAIKRAVREENCILADIASFKEPYESLDYAHPTKNGHRTLAELWLKALR